MKSHINAAVHRDECSECSSHRAVLESLACKQKGRMNVARINKGSTGAVTGRRFDVFDVPEYIL